MLMIKSTMALKTAVTLALAGLAFNASANLMISEVLYDAPNNDSLEEFVELYNASCSSIDLSQYNINDNGGSLALSGTLASGQYFTIAKDSAGFNSLFSRQADLAPMPLSLGNSGDYLKLLKGTQEVDVVAWEGGLSGWTLNGTNVSLVRTTITNTKSQADWSVSSNAGNPGVGSLTTSCGTPTPPVSENLLANGQTKASLSASTGQTLKFVADIPAGATNLSFNMSGGTGDADLYVRQGAEPTASTYECRPYLTGNNEACPIATAVAGRYFVNLVAYQGFSGVSLVANYTAASTGGTGGTGNPGNYAFDTYYANTNDKTGAALKASLNLIIRDHTRFTYDQVWDGLNYADEDPSNTNNVILLYTNRSEPKTNRAGMSSSLDAWNREHVWAKSHGFPSSSQYAYTDLHHLRPADVTVNSTRGNKDFAMGGDVLTEAPDNKSDSDSFEPANMVKGDVARMVFYMDVRYEGGDTSGTPNLTVAKGVTGTGEALLGDLCTLLSWHIQDPVSDWERRRNNRVYEWQLNRNPFIDNPMWAQDLYSSSCN
jgi:endonuclease I